MYWLIVTVAVFHQTHQAVIIVIIIFLVYHYLYLLMLSIDFLLLLLFFRRNFIYIQFVQNKIINKFIDDNIIWLTRSIQIEIRSICFDSRFYAIVLINFSFRTAILSLNLNRKKNSSFVSRL